MNRNEILRNDLEEEVDVGLPEGAGANLDLDVDNLADLIGQVTLTERLPVEPPPDVRQPVIRNVDRPLALTEELMPLNIARNDLRRDTQNLQMLGKMVRLITSGNENREGLEEEERNNFDDIILGLGHMHETVQRKQQLHIRKPLDRTEAPSPPHAPIPPVEVYHPGRGARRGPSSVGNPYRHAGLLRGISLRRCGFRSVHLWLARSLS